MSKTPLIAAVERLDLGSARGLLHERPDLLGITDRQGRNLLHLACAASPDVEDNTGVSARVKASRKRDKRYLAAMEAGE